jgi:hypothetical protein
MACYNPHVNGTSLPADHRPCERSWVAVVNNPTYRIYDLYVGSRLVGSAEPRATSRTTLDPNLGLVTPTLRESPTTRDQKGARIASGAVTMVCE